MSLRSRAVMVVAVGGVCIVGVACTKHPAEKVGDLYENPSGDVQSGADAGHTGNAGSNAASNRDAAAIGSMAPGDHGDAAVGATSGTDAGPDSAADGGSDAATQGTGPGDWKAGEYPAGDVKAQTYLEIKNVAGQNGNVRQYKVHVPASYDPSKPTPLVFCFHGVAQDAVSFCVVGSGLVDKADAAGFILVMPNGFQSSWNGGTCCGAAADMKLDDVALVRAIFGQLKSHLNVDLARVYATGFSNGGYLTYRLACEAADIFAAVAPGSGAIGSDDIGGGTRTSGDLASCAPKRPIAVLDLHGTADSIIPYSKQKPSLERMAAADGCGLTTHSAVQPKSGGDTTCLKYDGCPSGLDVTGCSVANGGHVWFGRPDCGWGMGPGVCPLVGNNSTMLVSTDAVWDFFAAHPR